MSKIRILRIVSVMNRGGIETQLMNLYRELDREKFQFDFLITRNEVGLFDEEIRSLGGKIYNIPSVREEGLISFAKNIDKFFKEHPYKIIHCHMNTWSGLILPIARLNKIPIRIAHSHTSRGSMKITSLKTAKDIILKIFMKKFIKFGATEYWAVSNEAGKWLFNKQYNTEKFRLFHNSKSIENYKFDIEKRIELRKNLNINDTDKVIGHIGSFSAVKNHEFIIELAKLIVKSDKSYKFILVGDGPLRNKYMDIVKNHKLESNIIFLGSRNDIPNILNIFDFLILPSKFEGLPNVVIESQLNGLPCLITDTITKEVDLGIGKVQFLSNKIPELWMERIFKMEKSNRVISLNSKITTDYNLKYQIKWLEDYYSDLSDW